MAASREPKALDYDAIVIGAGISGLYQLYRLRELGHAGAGVRGRHRRRRHLVLEPLSRARASIRRAIPTAIPSPRSCWRSGTGPSISRPSPRRCAISTSSPTSSTCAATSSSAARVDRRALAARRRGAGTSRWRTAASTRARFLITAIGPLSAPTMPRIEGVESFKGQSCHTARWPHEPVSFEGKRVAVIGTGATGVQTIQEVAKTAGHLTVFQRTPNWCAPLHNGQIGEEEMARDPGRLPRDLRALPGDLRLLPAHARPARHLRGDAGGARGVLGEALRRPGLRHLAGQLPRHADRPQGQRR